MAEPALVLVFFNGLPRYVPTVVGCYYAFRGALGAARGVSVRRERGEGEADALPPPTIWPTDFAPGEPWEFVEGERFVTVGFSLEGAGPPSEEDLEPWQKPDGWWKG